MSIETALLNALTGDKETHPERMCATIGRLKEVLNIVCPDKSAGIFDKYLKNACKPDKNGIAFLTGKAAAKISKVLAKYLTAKEAKNTAAFLNDAEISTCEAVALHETYKIPVSRLEKDVVFVRADGVWLFDTLGNKYIDMDSNYSATNLGNENKEIALGLFNQACQLISTKEDRVHIPRARFLSVIQPMLPKGLSQFYWQNSGGEAVDKALKIAKAYTKQKGVIALKGGFHGRTHGAVAVTYNEKYRVPFLLDKEDWVHFIEHNDAAAVEALMQSGKAKAIIMELVQGEEAGIRPLDMDFVKKVRVICDKYNGVMICDEVQTGFGRVAAKKGQWWASDVYGIVPDIMSIGKSFGGGYPVTAVVTTPEISSAMHPGYDGSTFGGNPMAMVAAYLATRQMIDRNITGNVVARSKQFKAGIEKIKKIYPDFIGEIRILGLMIGFELPSKEIVAQMQEHLREFHVHSSLSTGNAIRFLPPLVISGKETDITLKGIQNALAKIAGR
ncbi:MAG: aspartate aminotransferase family protein [Planctomycetes bacterium]|nr:aspartate aminotransferase family protein [Planctomycetota bacterium]